MTIVDILEFIELKIARIDRFINKISSLAHGAFIKKLNALLTKKRVTPNEYMKNLLKFRNAMMINGAKTIDALDHLDEKDNIYFVDKWLELTITISKQIITIHELFVEHLPKRSERLSIINEEEEGVEEVI